MRSFILAFLLGVLTLQQFKTLPNLHWIILFIPLALILKIFSKKFILFTAFLLGFSWTLWFAHHHANWNLPKELEGKTIVITGYIKSIPDISSHQTAFLFSLPAQGVIRLTSRLENQYFHVGDKWSFAVRLKRIHGLRNPGGFDFEAWAFQENIRASGYIVKSNENKLLNHHWYHSSLNRVRQFLKEKIEKNLAKSNTSPWIIALALGERHGILSSNWEVLRNTGCNHLMAIAGLHIGFMAGFAYAIMIYIWRRIPRLSLRLPAQQAGAIASLMMGLTYSALAGFSIPTQRACIMLSVFLVIILMKRKITAWMAWCLAVFFVLLFNPLSVLDASFWLSFGSVALIIYGVSARLSPKGLWWKWGRIQWVIALGLIPFSIWLFQQCSIVSFIANSIAIPWVGFLIVPLTLLGTLSLLFSEKIGGLILWFADYLLSWLWTILTYLAHLSWSTWYQVIPSNSIIFLACVGVIILLFPAGFPGRFFGVIWLLPLFLFKPAAPKIGEAWLTLLDVGQGLSAIIQTEKHILVFDTGAKLSDSYDMGESVVIPFLRSIGAKKIDMLVVSHGDNDHIGGSYSLLKNFSIPKIKTSVPEEFSEATYCLRHESWNWDQVQFQFLYPPPENLNLDNDGSCVLRVTTGDKHILLTGDIEKLSEKFLVQQDEKKLPANILIAPHHGSKTSAENEFLNAVRPQYVLFPVGYRNRYHFPHPSVVLKYQKLNSILLDTANMGAIQFVMNKDFISKPGLYREEYARYWHLSM